MAPPIDVHLLGWLLANFALYALLVYGAIRILRSLPRDVSGWARETSVVSLRVPATGALYAAGLLAYLWARARV